MLDQKKIIAIVKYQQSVIVRGIERKLTEMKYDIMSIDPEDSLSWKNALNNADLFIIYLDGEVRTKDDTNLIKDLRKMFADVDAISKKIILIGDEDDQAHVSDALPAIWSHIWISRPIDVKKLMKEVREQTMDEDEMQVEKHILIVDDDPAYAKIVRGWLKDDYKVDVVTAGMQAITFLSRNSVDLVLLDYEMPVTDGPQVLQMFRQEPSLAELPVIFLTGVDSAEAVSRAAHLKPDGYILKTTSRGDLMMYIKNVFKKYQDNED